jgi:hypothetical protein
MKMVKSLLLGSAAGVVALAGAQAADLPVKAKPVQYVKICSLYGVGFYYIPGTDTCIKIGGWVREQYDYGMDASTTLGPFLAGQTTRALGDSNSVWRTRAYITADVRSQTPYGTVRAYMDTGLISTDVGGASGTGAHANRAFIQWAGFTFGLATSFFDLYSGPAVSYLPNYPQSQTGGGGWMVAAYTAQLGNGFSATISAESPRRLQIIGQGTTSTSALFAAGGVAGMSTGGGVPNLGYGSFESPDIVGNLRVDQAWGSAQIMAAAHQDRTTYYASTGANFLGAGHPGDKWGFAIGAGIKLNAPMIGHGDYFQAQFNYSQGALGYIFSPQIQMTNYYMRHGDTAGYGILSDAVFGGAIGTGNATGLNLTTGWGVNASFEHHWNPQWQTSIYGGYAEVNYNQQANAILCGLIGGGNATGVGSTAVATAGCNQDWSFWHVGSRTQWNITKDFYMGVDVMYAGINSASTFDGIVPPAQNMTGVTGNGVANFIGDQDALSVEFRVHKNFYP